MLQFFALLIFLYQLISWLNLVKSFWNGFVYLGELASVYQRFFLEDCCWSSLFRMFLVGWKVLCKTFDNFCFAFLIVRFPPLKFYLPIWFEILSGPCPLREGPGGGEQLCSSLHGGDGVRLWPITGGGAQEDCISQTGFPLHPQTPGHYQQWEVKHGALYVCGVEKRCCCRCWLEDWCIWLNK